jgi:AcrR family transcriptional regulator
MSKTKDLNAEQNILNAAKHVFQRKGLDGTRMQEIANEAGINKALLHYYFRSKQLLFEAVFKNAFSLLAPQLNKILNDESSIEDKIKKFTHNYITFISKHPYIPNFVIQEINKNPEFIIKLKGNPNFPNLNKFKNQVNDEVNNGFIKPIKAEQLFINILSLSVFPFIGSPLIKTIGNINDAEYKQLIDERKTHVASFIINSIKA